MKLGDAGEAFFVEECSEENFPTELATSPIPSFEMLLDNGIKELHQAAAEEVGNCLSEVSQLVCMHQNNKNLTPPPPLYAHVHLLQPPLCICTLTNLNYPPPHF